MTIDQRLDNIRIRETEVNTRRAILQSKIAELEKHRMRLEQELSGEGVDISDPEKALDTIRQNVLNILDDAEVQITETEKQLMVVEEQIEEKINFIAN